MRFSQRKGITPVKTEIQKESMDDDLRNTLWNALTECYWDLYWRSIRPGYYSLLLGGETPPEMSIFLRRLWHDYFKEPIDGSDKRWKEIGKIYLEKIEKYYFSCEWYEVYDFIDFIAKNFYNAEVNKIFIDMCDSVLERELSAYRFVGNSIAEITSEEEISEIEESLEGAPPAVREHLESALALFSDRKSPDYRNSMKESILAVEAICKLITGDKKATLGRALDELQEVGVKSHPALVEGFKKLYGYTSSADGIRHALLEESNLSQEDAKFMLVACSAFTNYLLVKSSKAGININ